MKKNKKAQVATTTTWIVATLIIVVTLLVFFYFANLLAGKSLFIKIKQKSMSLGFSEDYNLFTAKTSSAYVQTPESKKGVIEKWINQQEISLENFVKNL